MTYKFVFAEDGECKLCIYRESSKKRKEIKFADFVEIVKNGGFRIYREFRCTFTRQIVLEGSCHHGNYSVMTDDIDEIIYECDG